MQKTVIHLVGWMLILVLLQAVVFNHIALYGYATPFVYIYAMVKLKADTGRNAFMLWGFGLGLLVDTFSNSPGMHASATLFLAFVRPTLLNLFMPHDNNEVIIPSMHSMGVGAFVKYLSLCVLLHHLFLFPVAFFSLSSPLEVALRILSSALLTTLCLLAFEALERRKDLPLYGAS